MSSIQFPPHGGGDGLIVWLAGIDAVELGPHATERFQAWLPIGPLPDGKKGPRYPDEGATVIWTAELSALKHAIDQENWAWRQEHKAFLEAETQREEAIAIIRELVPEGWADDDTMDHMPGIKRARLFLNEHPSPAAPPAETKYVAPAVDLDGSSNDFLTRAPAGAADGEPARRWWCSHCTQWFTTEAMLDAHESSEHEPRKRPLLSPCPFCQGGKARVRRDDVAYLPPHCWAVICECGACGPNMGTEEGAITQWNRRAPSPSNAGER